MSTHNVIGIHRAIDSHRMSYWCHRMSQCVLFDPPGGHLQHESLVDSYGSTRGLRGQSVLPRFPGWDRVQMCLGAAGAWLISAALLFVWWSLCVFLMYFVGSRKTMEHKSCLFSAFITLIGRFGVPFAEPSWTTLNSAATYRNHTFQHVSRHEERL